MTHPVPEFDIAVVGAGLAGSALACALNNSGWRVVLLEGGGFPSRPPECRSQLDSFDPRVSALTLASRQLFERLGVWANMQALRVRPFTDMFVWDGEGTGEIAFSAAEVDREELGYIVENRVIIYTLLESLRLSSNVKMLERVKVKAVTPLPGEPSPGHRLQITGEKGDDLEIRATLVVGADGASSFIRQACEFPTREWDYGQHAIVCTVTTEKPHNNTAWQRFTHNGVVALLPLATSADGQNFCSIVWSVDNDQVSAIMALDDVAFVRALATATEAKLGRIEAASPRYSFPLRQRHSVDYVKPGVALIADAAHTMHPLAGQGINLGLQDVVVLVEELARAKESGLSPGDIHVLSRYQRRRKVGNLVMMSVMEGFKQLFAQRSLLVRWLRNKGMLGVGKFDLLKRKIMKQATGIE